MTAGRDELELALAAATDAAERYGQKFGGQGLTIFGLGEVASLNAATRLMDEAIESGEPTSDAALNDALEGTAPPADAVI